MVKAILFDMDGTLIDSETFYVEQIYQCLHSTYAHITRNDIHKVIGNRMDIIYQYLADITSEDLETIKRSLQKHFDDNPIDFSKVIFKEVKTVLKKLKELGYILCVCSMSNDDEVNNCLISCDIKQYIDFVFTGDHCLPKPAPDIYLKALKSCGLNHKQALVVEDARQGIEAGKNAGIKVIARKDEKFGIDQSKADILIDNLEELIEILRSNNE